MTKIKHLTESTINEIAAGEVIERPASVVRELVDNSVDAGASFITVELEDGGHSLIRVSDDGSGISSEDLKIAFERHTTSKLQSVDDLKSISTKGFRGEALSSIAAVSRVTVLTKTNVEPVGSEIRIDGGETLSFTAKPTGVGTTIEVNSLYFNTPARRKFLKTDKAESDKVKSWLAKYALCHPNVHFKLKSNGVVTLELPKRDSTYERAEQIYRGNFITAERKVGDFFIKCFLSHPGESTSRASNFIIFVNNRLVNDKAIVKAVKDGYSSLLKSYETPTGFITLDLPKELVDINVHPQKSEVRIANQNSVFGIVKETVRKALAELNIQIQADDSNELEEEKFDSIANDSSVPTREENLNPYKRDFVQQGELFRDPKSYSSIDFTNINNVKEEEKDLSVETVDVYLNKKNPNIVPSFKEDFLYQSLNFIGEIFSCYLLCSTQEKFYIVDKHAAHERVNFNKIKDAFLKKSIQKQLLLFPETIKIEENNSFSNLFYKELNYAEVFDRFGFLAEVKKEENKKSFEIQILETPTFIKHESIKPFVNELLAMIYETIEEEEEISDLTSSNIDTLFEHKQDAIIARLACHASIRSGDYINQTEVKALLQELDKTPYNYACPHGRPIVIEFKENDLEKWFGR